MRLTFQTAEIGEVIGPVPLAVDDHFVKGFAFAVDDWSAPYFTNAGKCGPLAHSCAVAKKLLHLFAARYDTQDLQSVHLKEDIWFDVPVRFGESIALTGRYVEKFVRKGRPTTVFESEACDENGNILVRQRSLEIMQSDAPLEDTENERVPDSGAYLSGRRVSAVLPHAPQFMTHATAVIPSDICLPVMTKTIHQDQIAVFCGANENWKNLHTDLEVARKAGFSTTIMSGMIQMCWFTEMLVSFFGAGFLSGGRLGGTFLAPVSPQESVDCFGVVRGVDGSGRVEIEMWARRASDQALTCAAWASAPAMLPHKA